MLRNWTLEVLVTLLLWVACSVLVMLATLPISLDYRTWLALSTVLPAPLVVFVFCLNIKQNRFAPNTVTNARGKIGGRAALAHYLTFQTCPYCNSSAFHQSPHTPNRLECLNCGAVLRDTGFALITIQRP